MKQHHSSGGGEFEFNLNPTYYSQLALTYQLLPEGAKSILAVAKLVLDFVLSVFTLPLEVLLLARWGTRALSLYQVVQVTFLAALSVLVPDKLLTAFFLASAVFAWWRFIEARRGEWVRRPYRHSYAPGEPVVWEVIARFLVTHGVPRRLFTEDSVFRLWEPATGFIVGVPLLLLPFTRIFGAVLVGIGLIFLVKRHIMHLRKVSIWRDMADAETVGRVMSAPADTATEEVHAVHLAVVVDDPAPLPTSLIPTTPGSASPDRVRVVCGACGTRIKCPASRAGETLPCPKCASHITVPPATAA